MGKKQLKRSRGLNIGRDVNISNGDFVAGNKNVEDGAPTININRNMTGSNIVIGDRNKISDFTQIYETMFVDVSRKIKEHPKIASDDKEDLIANVEELKAEIGKGESADEPFLLRRLRNIKRIAPDIADVMIATIASPASGFAVIVRKVAEQMASSPADHL